MAAKYDCVLFHGPPFSGTDVYYQKNLAKGHQVICPKEIFSSNSRCGLRDIVLKVIKLLKEDKQVVVDDDNGTVAKRTAYIKMIKNKLPRKTIALVILKPRYGEPQVLWASQIYLNSHQCVPVKPCEINSWFDPKTKQLIYSTNDEPDEMEGYTIFHVTSHLQTYSTFKFEIPALFIQVEGLYKAGKDVIVDERIKDICAHWNEVNPTGRVIFLQYGVKEYSDRIKDMMVEVVQQIEFPVYLINVNDPTEAGPYVEPPNPGILAYLQKRHCLQLHSSKTAYIYQSNEHMKMAMNAGVNCVKMSRILLNPVLINGSHVMTTSTIPQYLQTMEILPHPDRTNSVKDAKIPGMKNREEFKNSYFHTLLPSGREEFLFAKSFETIVSYQELYQSCVSVLKNPENIHTQAEDSNEESNVVIDTSHNDSTRELPKWMKTQSSRKLSDKSSLKRIPSNSSKDAKIKNTLYIMTEEELVEMATEVLKQAGREDILEKMETEKQLMQDCPSSPEPHKYEHSSDTMDVKTSAFKIEVRKSPHSKIIKGRDSKVVNSDKNRVNEQGQVKSVDSKNYSKCSVLDEFMTELPRKASPKKNSRKRFATKQDTAEDLISDKSQKLNTEDNSVTFNFTHIKQQNVGKCENKCAFMHDDKARNSEQKKKLNSESTKSGKRIRFSDSQEPGPSNINTRTKSCQVKYEENTHEDDGIKGRGNHSDKMETKKTNLSILDEIFS